MEDILLKNDISEHNEVPTSKKPNIQEVVFDVKSYLHEILNDIGIRFINEKGNEYSLIDLQNFRGVPISDLKKLFITSFGINPSTKEGISEINDIFNLAKKSFSQRYLKHLPNEIYKKNITSINDVKKILDNTGSNLSGVFYCAISKFFLLHALMLKDQRIINIKKIHKTITSDMTSIFEESEEVRQGVRKGTIRIGGKDIVVDLFHRHKTIESISGKMIGNKQYNTIDDFYDLHGYTIEMKTDDNSNIIRTMQKYYHTMITQNSNIDEIIIENKGLITLEDIENTQGLDNIFKELLIKSIEKGNEKTNSNSDDNKDNNKTYHKYEDIKFKIKYNTQNPIKGLAKIKSGTEIKFTKYGNENENGLAFHAIFDGNKRFKELTRAVGYVRQQDIIKTVNMFFKRLDQELQKKGKKRSDYILELIEDLGNDNCMEKIEYQSDDDDIMKKIAIGLFNYYEKGLKKVKSSKRSKNFFYIHKSYYDLTPDVVPNIINID